MMNIEPIKAEYFALYLSTVVFIQQPGQMILDGLGSGGSKDGGESDGNLSRGKSWKPLCRVVCLIC
jgi:hypothetical protein